MFLTARAAWPRLERSHVFLASDEASCITGANLVIDGGWSSVLPG